MHQYLQIPPYDYANLHTVKTILLNKLAKQHVSGSCEEKVKSRLIKLKSW